MKKISLCVLFILFSVCLVNAQFLKGLGKKVENAAEKTIERKAEEKTRKGTEKAIDAAFEKKKKGKRKTGGLSTAEPASSYSFNYRVEIQMISGKEEMKMDYFLPKEGEYVCVQIEDKKIDGDFFTVFDVEREAMFSYMENEDQKMRMAIDFKNTEVNASDENFSVAATGKTKDILGYTCKEYLIKGKELSGTAWVTRDVDFRFPSNFYGQNEKDYSNLEWMSKIDGWAMQTTLMDTSKKKTREITMNCISISETSFQIISSHYNSLSY